MKLFFKNRLFISLLSSAISATFLLAPVYAMDPSEEDRGQYAHKRVRDPDNVDPFSLFWSTKEDDKEIGAAALKEIIQDPSHKNYSEAAQTLFRNGTEEEQRAVPPLCINLFKIPIMSCAVP